MERPMSNAKHVNPPISFAQHSAQLFFQFAAFWCSRRFLIILLGVWTWSTFVTNGQIRAVPIVNGSFETGDFSAWTNTGNVLVLLSPFLASDGTYSAHFNRSDAPPNGTLTQNFSTLVGVEYEVRFDHAVLSAGFHNQNLHIEVLGNSVLLAQSVSDSSVTSAIDPPTFDTSAFQFVADSTLTTLSFRDDNGNRTDSTDTILDNIRVSAVVPEPSTLLLVGIALLATTLRRPARY
jgi:hypothetical protein